jgi:hypothetical protein
MLQLLVDGSQKTPSSQLSGLQTSGGGDAEKEVTEDTQDYNGVFSPNLTTPGVLCGSAPGQDRGTAAASDTSGGSGRFYHNETHGPCGLTPTQTADNRSVRAPNINSFPRTKC